MYSHTFRFAGAEPFTTGCTAVVTARFYGGGLNPDGMLIDICVAQRLLRDVMELYDHKNLDTLAEFCEPHRNTTVEVMARAICKHLLEGLRAHGRAGEGADAASWLGNLTKLEVLVQESDVACAGYYEHIPAGFLVE